jgi:uncharacterized protein (DUF1501 family)
MKRRQFVKLSGLTTTAALIPGFLKAFGQTTVEFSGKRIVIVQLSGGNDGLNTLIPFRNDIYYSQRPRLGIKPEKLLKISDEAGFNPALTGFQKLFEQGRMGIYNGVGYPNPDRSHFRSMDIWHTASNSDEYLNTGWIGRMLDSKCPGSENPWYALEVDDTLSLAMKGAYQSGFAVKDPDKLNMIVQDTFFKQLANRQKQSVDSDELSFLYKTLAETTASASYIYEKSKIYKSTFTYPQAPLGAELKQIAELIRSGIESKLFYTSISGFDTHARQTDVHGRILGVVGNSLSTFVDDLAAGGELDNTVILVFSEFGRRVKQNAGNGTDHGTANNVYVIGGALKQKGILNPLSNLSDLENGDLKHQLDFRSIYATLLDNWIGFDQKIVLGRSFEKLGFV